MSDSEPCLSHSITCLIDQLKGDNAAAASQIWQRYFDRLLPLARAKISSSSRRMVDEEDVLVSVFDRFFIAASEGRFARLNDRNDLWQILLMLTERKVIDQFRRESAEKRGGGLVRDESQLPLSLDNLEDMVDREPSPEMVIAFNDNLDWAINRLGNNKTRDVALLRLEGYSNREIAEQLKIGLSSVERKLRVIRELWQKQNDETV